MLPAALRIPAFRRLVTASTLSITGSMATFVMLPVVVWEQTGSSATFGLVMTGGSIGMIVAMPFGGVIADRYDRRRVLLLGDAVALLNAVLMLLAVTAQAWWALPFLSFVSTALGSLFVSAGPALRRDVVPDELRAQANAIHTGGVSVSNLLGPLVGGALYACLGFSSVIVFDIVSYGLSFVLVLGIRVAPRAGLAALTSVAGGALRRLRRDLAAGMSLTRRDPYLRLGAIANLVNGAANGFLLVAVVPWLDTTLDLPSAAWGGAIAAMGGAAVLGSVALGRIGDRVPAATIVKAGAASFAVAALMLLGTPSLARVVVAFALIGLVNAAIMIGATTITQRRVPSTHMGRTSSLQMLSHQLTQGITTAGAAVVVATAGPQVAMAIAVFGFVCSSAIYWRGATASVRTRPVDPVSDSDLSLGA